MIPFTASRIGLFHLDRYINIIESSNSYSWTNSGTTTFNIIVPNDGRGQFIPLIIEATTVAKTGTNTVSISYGITGGGVGPTAYSALTSGMGTLNTYKNIEVAFNTATVSLAGGGIILMTWNVGSGGVASTCTIKSSILGLRLNR